MSQAELEDARAVLRSMYPSGLPTYRRARPGQELISAHEIGLFSLAILALPAIVFGVVLRGGLMFRVTGIALQTADGGLASRVRCFLRASLVWVPFLLFWPELGFNLTATSLSVLSAAFPLIELAAFVQALVKPERGIPDLIVGTYLVPK